MGFRIPIFHIPTQNNHEGPDGGRGLVFTIH